MNDVLDRFIEFLRAASTYGTIGDWHIVFDAGTVVRSRHGDVEFAGYDASYVNEYPAEDEELRQVIVYNIAVWSEQKEWFGDHDERGSALRAGYQKLIDDGLSDDARDARRAAIPLQRPDATHYEEDILWTVVWNNRDPDIANLVIDHSAEAAASIAREYRRYDFMFPKVYAVIAPDLTLHRVPGGY